MKMGIKTAALHPVTLKLAMCQESS